MLQGKGISSEIPDTSNFIFYMQFSEWHISVDCGQAIWRADVSLTAHPVQLIEQRIPGSPIQPLNLRLPVSVLKKLDYPTKHMQCHKSALALALLVKGLDYLSIIKGEDKSFDFSGRQHRAPKAMPAFFPWLKRVCSGKNQTRSRPAYFLDRRLTTRHQPGGGG